MSESTNRLAENKLILLYLIYKMDLPLANSEICQFILERNYIDYFTLQQYLSELIDTNFLMKSKENNNTFYQITEQGESVLHYFYQHISEEKKNEILKYVFQNKGRIKQEYEVAAHYFPELNGDYTVKCSLCDGEGANLLDMSIAVPNQEQAKLICLNWKQNISYLYANILHIVTHPVPGESMPEQPPPSSLSQ